MKRWNFMVCYAIALHLVWGQALLSEPAVLGVTAIAELRHLPLAGDVGFALHQVVGALMLLAAGLSAAGLLWRGSWSVRLLLLAGQQFLLMMAASGALDAMIASAYADGVARPRQFLIADQAPAVLVAILHALAVLEELTVWERLQAIWKQWKTQP